MTLRVLLVCSSSLLLSLVVACGGSEDSASPGAPAGGSAGVGGGDAGSAGVAGSEGDAGQGGAAGAAGAAGAPAVLEPTLASLQAGFFTPSCATSLCHSAKQKAGGISLASEAETCAALVGAKATESGPVGANSCAKGAAAKAGMLRVKPGSPDESFAYLKVASPEKCVTIDGALAGDRMPKGKPAASSAAVSALAEWITSGAACQ